MMDFADIWNVNFKKTAASTPTCSFCDSDELVDEDGETGYCNRCGLIDCPTCENKGGCSYCGGRTLTCDKCGGHGRLPLTHPDARVVINTDRGEEYSGVDNVECKNCEGTGRLDCAECDGEGTCWSCERPPLMSVPYVEGEAREVMELPERR